MYYYFEHKQQYYNEILPPEALPMSKEDIIKTKWIRNMRSSATNDYLPITLLDFSTSYVSRFFRRSFTQKVASTELTFAVFQFFLCALSSRPSQFRLRLPIILPYLTLGPFVIAFQLICIVWVMFLHILSVLMIWRVFTMPYGVGNWFQGLLCFHHVYLRMLRTYRTIWRST